MEGKYQNMHIGTANLGTKTSSIRIITKEVMKLYEKINIYDKVTKNSYKSFVSNPFCKPQTITIIWVDKKDDFNF